MTKQSLDGASHGVSRSLASLATGVSKRTVTCSNNPVVDPVVDTVVNTESFLHLLSAHLVVLSTCPQVPEPDRVVVRCRRR